MIEWEIRAPVPWIRAAVLELGQAQVVVLAAAEPAAASAHADAERAVGFVAAARPERARRSDPHWWQAELGRIYRELTASASATVSLAAVAIEAGSLSGAARGEVGAFLFAADSFAELTAGGPAQDGPADGSRGFGPLPFVGTLLVTSHPQRLQGGFASWMAAASQPSLLSAADTLAALARGTPGAAEVGFVLARSR